MLCSNHFGKGFLKSSPSPYHPQADSQEEIILQQPSLRQSLSSCLLQILQRLSGLCIILQGLLGAHASGSMYVTFLSAAMAGATSCLALHPMEVLRSRLTCDNAGQYSGLISATRQIVSNEGVGALYQGLGPSLLAILPEAAVTYGTDSQAKHGPAALVITSAILLASSHL